MMVLYQSLIWKASISWYLEYLTHSPLGNMNTSNEKHNFEICVGGCFWWNFPKKCMWCVLLYLIMINQDPLDPLLTGSLTHQYVIKGQYVNTFRPRQMDAISQTTFSNAFSWMKMFEFRLKFHWSLFLRFQLTIFQHWFRYWLGAVQATSHYLNQWWLVYWRIYASLGLNELN